MLQNSENTHSMVHRTAKGYAGYLGMLGLLCLWKNRTPPKGDRSKTTRQKKKKKHSPVSKQAELNELRILKRQVNDPSDSTVKEKRQVPLQLPDPMLATLVAGASSSLTSGKGPSKNCQRAGTKINRVTQAQLQWIRGSIGSDKMESCSLFITRKPNQKGKTLYVAEIARSSKPKETARSRTKIENKTSQQRCKPPVRWQPVDHHGSVCIGILSTVRITLGCQCSRRQGPSDLQIPVSVCNRLPWRSVLLGF